MYSAVSAKVETARGGKEPLGNLRPKNERRTIAADTQEDGTRERSKGRGGRQEDGKTQ